MSEEEYRKILNKLEDIKIASSQKDQAKVAELCVDIEEILVYECQEIYPNPKTISIGGSLMEGRVDD